MCKKALACMMLAATPFYVLSTSPAAYSQQVIQGCSVFPANNVWNTRIDKLPVDVNSATYVRSLGAATHLHPDLGTNSTYGIPYNVVPSSMPKSKVKFDYADESDPGPYPVSTKLLIEGGSWNSGNGGDRHVLMIDPTAKKLYELYDTHSTASGFTAGSGAIFPLSSNQLRPNGWTSADAAGLPVLPGLLNYTEASSGKISHALRLTCQHTRGYIWPARHQAGAQISGWPPMGQRFRLKASFDISKYSKINKVILTALKDYGMFVADNGSNWYVTGAPDSRWNDADLNNLKNLKGSDFEAVDESSLIVNPDSAKAK